MEQPKLMAVEIHIERLAYFTKSEHISRSLHLNMVAKL